MMSKEEKVILSQAISTGAAHEPMARMASLASSVASNAARISFFLRKTSPALYPSGFFSFRNVHLSTHVLNNKRFSTSETASKRNTKVNFSLSDSDDDDVIGDSKKVTEIDKSKLPPPYNPFDKKAVVDEVGDPKNLQEIFHKMREDGLQNSAVKMFDALSKDGLTHEALQLFAQIKDKGHMPDVVAHTAVIEVYANAGQIKEAHKTYMRMLASGVSPNAYTYTVLIKALSADPKFLEDAKKYLLEMMSKGMRPNAGTYVAVFEAFSREKKVDEAKEFLRKLQAEGFVAEENAVRDVLNSKRGPLFRSVINILFGK